MAVLDTQEISSDAEGGNTLVAETPDAGDQMRGFAKGLAVIEAYGRGRSALTIAEVARLSKLDRASARRCLLTLVNRGYASTDGRYFQLTPRVLRLGHAYLSASLPTLIQPTLDALATDLGESCSAAVLDGTEIVYIARASRHRLIGVGLHAGSRLPAYCTAMGRVLLAAQPADVARDLITRTHRVAMTERTLTDVGHLMGELDRVRADGYAIIDQEVEIGSMAIAVPLRNLSGRTVASIVVAMHATPAASARLRSDVLTRLREAQAQLAQILP